MSKKIVLLLVEDSENDALLVERELRKSGYEPVIARVEDADSMRTALQLSSWDIVIADYNLPHFSGPDAFRLLVETGMDIPFIIVSGSIGEEVAVEAMRLGVNDYVMKSNMARLTGAVEREIRQAADRAARRAAEDQLKQAERLRTIGELMSSVIHDLKNPLHAILMSAELLVEDCDPEDLKSCHAIIVNQVQRIVAMSDDILEFARGNVQLSLRPVDLVALVREMVEANARVFAAGGIELSYALPSNRTVGLTITADHQKLWRVFQNLINNAKDAMTKGGSINIELSESNDQVILEFKDTGGGIPAEIRNTLFEPFVTLGKSEGTGLGLAIVKNIVENHKGTVSFNVEEGVGTTFRIQLPAHHNVTMQTPGLAQPAAVS